MNRLLLPFSNEILDAGKAMGGRHCTLQEHRVRETDTYLRKLDRGSSCIIFVYFVCLGFEEFHFTEAEF